MLDISFINRTRRLTLTPYTQSSQHGIISLVVIGCCLANGACAFDIAQSDIAELPIEELGQIEVTSVSKRNESLANAAAAIFVITHEDIRRSGATSIPEALRLAPNLHVAQVNAHGYAISARGFNNNAANKLLVLIDGRSIYTPLFSGVFWDVQDVMLEDVERIEVVSGPGGTLWGSNAVNGVINIITRSAKSTQGTLAVATGGTRESGAALRYGGSIGEDGNYRIYGKYTDAKTGSLQDGSSMGDGWYRSQAGFQTDWQRGANHLSVQGNIYHGAEGQPLPGMISIAGVKLALESIPLSGKNLTTRWTHAFDGNSNLIVQAYYDQTERTVPPTFAESLDIVDLQVQHSLKPIQRHTLTWGIEYRRSRDHLTNSSYFAFLPADIEQVWRSLFIQDVIALGKNLELTIGERVEHNDYTGSEQLPSARLGWTFSPNHLLWGAISRTVRSPSRLDRDTFIPGQPPFLLNGGPDVQSEIANVFELGFRAQPASDLSYSVTLFHSIYDQLRTQELAPSRRSVFFANEMEGTTTGLEIWGTYQANAFWRLSAGYTGLRERLRLKPGSNDQNAVGGAGRDPANNWVLRSSLELPHQSEMDATLHRVAALSNPEVPTYFTLDLRYAWKPRPDLELSVIGQSLTGSGHAEFGSQSTRIYLERGVLFKVVGEF